LIGPGGDRCAARLVAAHPELAGRLVATGALPAGEVSRHLQACDLLVQPYPDGATTRRGSLMASLAHGVATASTLGRLSEPVWAETGCLALAPADDPAALVRAAEAVLASPATRAQLGALGRRVYGERFSWERTVKTLLRNSQ
jgi:glycosyltransferase involved in cell wall biosynthesis